jgi:hypothetical protein
MRAATVFAGGLVAGAWLAAAPPPTVAAAAGAAMSIRGVITDTSGAPVAADTVRLLKTRKVRVLGAAPDADQAIEEARARTDAEGRFTIDAAIDNAFPFWFVRFYDPATFDGVKYRLPADLDVSRQVRAGAVIDAGVVLKFHPDWPQVRALVDEYGASSRRGQILRSLGLPTRRTPGDEGHETWEFARAGVTYVLDGDRVIETRRAPTAGQPPAPTSGPVPAEKVEGS